MDSQLAIMGTAAFSFGAAAAGYIELTTKRSGPAALIGAMVGFGVFSTLLFFAR